MRFAEILAGLFAHRRGAVSLLAALALPCLIGTAGLVVEYGHGVLEKVENQRVADLSAYAGAVAYNAATPTSTATAAMTSAAQAVAVLNGIPAAQVTAAVVASPTGTANTNAVRVTVTTSVPLIFARLIGSTRTLAVPAESYAELRPSIGPCILALSPTAGGIALTGGTQITASGCAIASDAAVSVPCGPWIKSAGVSYNTTLTQGCPGSIMGPDGTAATAVIAKKPTPDPLASNAGVVAARGRLAAVGTLVPPAGPSAPPAPAAPVVVKPSGTPYDIDLAYNSSSTQTQAIALGCTASQSGSMWTLACPAGQHNFGSLTVGGGLALTLAGTAGTVYNFIRAMTTGPAISFGAGTFTFVQGLTIGYGGASFGSGTLNVIGQLSTGASGGSASFAENTINVTGNAVFAGTTTLSGTGTLSVGGVLTTSGTTNIAQTNVNVTGDMSFGGSTTLSGTGTFAVGGTLTTGGSPAIAQSTITATGAFNVTNSLALPNLTTLSVGGLMNIGTSGTMTLGSSSAPLTASFASGLQTTGSSVVTFAAGNFNIGRMASANDGAQYSLYSGAASTTFGGPSVFQLSSGLDIRGGATLILGNAGTDNSFKIGPSYAGAGPVYSNAVLVGGGSTFKMGDATGAASVFQIGGTFSSGGGNGGGSCTVVAAAAQHDIDGSLLTAGAMIFGSGVYTIYGSVGIGANGGGEVNCNGAMTGLLANGVSLVVGGNGAGLTGTCVGQSFCVAAGYSNVVLTAPTAGPTAKMAIIGPASLTGGAYFTGGANSTLLSGLVYFPVGTVRLDGAASVGNAVGQCLQLIGKEVLLNGGSMLASTCISGSSSGGGNVVLVK
nr:pilus assembly protein TadG-related protein [Polymorphobacter sp.]